MEEKNFINRNEEKKQILDSLGQSGPDLIIVYGRRRVGKSRFLREIADIKKIKLFIMLEDNGYENNLAKVSKIIANELKLPSFRPKTFRELFESLPEKSTIILDEYSYIASATAEFQGIWEEVIKKKKIKLILSGSMIRVMEDLNYSLTSPLYGRATKIIKMLPLNIHYLKDWYGQKVKWKDCLETFFVVGGIPRYLEIIDTPGIEGIKESFFSKNSLFLREGKLLLKESFPKSDVLPKVFFTIASGDTEASKIASKAGLKGSEISKYLSLLIDYGFIEKKFPVFGGGKKDVQFYPLDPFMIFWMRFIWEYYSEIDLGFTKRAEENFDSNFLSFCGQRFEKVLLEIILTKNSLIPHSFSKIGNQWGRIQGLKGQNYEIDLIAINDKNKSLTAIEAKWQDNVNAEHIVKELDKNLTYCPNISDYKNITLLVIAKSFKKKITTFNSKIVNCIEIKELE